METKLRPRTRRIASRLLTIALLSTASAVSCGAVEVEGFTEPYRTVNVASPEQGIVTDVPVRIGDAVRKGQVVATLDDELHLILLATARERKDARGRLESAEAEVRMRRTRLDKLQELRDQGFGRKEEVVRATADYEIAEAELKAVREDLIDKNWQFQKIQVELERRTIRAPMDGVIAERIKEPGEYVAPNEPNVVTMVQLDPLLAKFSMKQSLSRHVRLGQQVSIHIDSIGRIVTGVVDVVSPVVDAQSGTIRVKVRIANAEGLILSGERCMIDIPVNDITPTHDEQPPAKKVAGIRSYSWDRQ